MEELTKRLETADDNLYSLQMHRQTNIKQSSSNVTEEMYPDQDINIRVTAQHDSDSEEDQNEVLKREIQDLKEQLRLLTNKKTDKEEEILT